MTVEIQYIYVQSVCVHYSEIKICIPFLNVIFHVGIKYIPDFCSLCGKHYGQYEV